MTYTQDIQAIMPELLEALYLATEALQDAATFYNAPEGYWEKGGAGYEANDAVLNAITKITHSPHAGKENG